MKTKKTGKLVISLDFELFWGVTDSRTIENYGKDILTGRDTIPALLELFNKYQIHATWGTVGMLFANSKKELAEFLPKLQPSYINTQLSAYKHFETIGENETTDPLHYAPSIISTILSNNNQEIGSHTFCHYYCREKGQNYETFDSDIVAAKKIAEKTAGIELKSLIFPRNQFNNEYLQSLKKNQIIAVRGNQKTFVYNSNKMIARIFRMIDTYIPICGTKCYYEKDCYKNGIVDLTASIFFRKYNKKLFFLESIKMWNIKFSMKHAAKKGKVVHIWWHPHNMGANPDIFLKQLEDLLIYYKKLNDKYIFESKNMGELAEEIINEKNCNAM